MGTGPKLWEFNGKTGPEAEDWQHADILIGFRKNRFQVSLTLVLLLRYLSFCSTKEIQLLFSLADSHKQKMWIVAGWAFCATLMISAFSEVIIQSPRLNMTSLFKIFTLFNMSVYRPNSTYDMSYIIIFLTSVWKLLSKEKRVLGSLNNTLYRKSANGTFRGSISWTICSWIWDQLIWHNWCWVSLCGLTKLMLCYLFFCNTKSNNETLDLFVLSSPACFWSSR